MEIKPPMIDKIPREEIDRLLFNVMAAIYHFERHKMSLFDLNFESLYLLYFLRRRSSASMGEIAKELNVHISTASRVVDRLEKKSFVSRKKNANDKRTTLVCLEPEGEHMVHLSEGHSYELIKGNLERFHLDDLEAFVKTASAMGHLLNTNPHPQNDI
jgi:DNA-binding MarR family transcriptional regulator